MLASSYFNVHKTNRWFYACNANNLQIVSKSENCVVKMMESVAVIKGWHWCKESKAYGFVTRLWQIQNITCVCINAETCNFTTVSEYKCGNRNVTHYTEKVIKDVMLAGVRDGDIKRVSCSVLLARRIFCPGHPVRQFLSLRVGKWVAKQPKFIDCINSLLYSTSKKDTPTQ